MKSLIKVLFVGAMLTVLLFGYGSTVLGTNASAQTVNYTVISMFLKHPDFPCVSSFKFDLAHETITKVSVPVMATNEQITNFAQSVGMDTDFANCFGWVWTFDRDVNATHYANAGRTMTQADRDALYYHDVNEVIAELGGMPAWTFILDNGRPQSGHWQRYPTRYLGFFD